MFGEFGVWARKDEWGENPARAAELEELGYTAIWVGGSPDADLAEARRVLDATESITVATSIVNVWTAEAAEVTQSFHSLGSDRLVLGVGVGHRKFHAEYEKPFTKLTSYLDELDVPADRILLAALGPKALRLAAERTAGAHPYMTSVAHTESARPLLGTKLLAPEVTVVVDDDHMRARAKAREFVSFYLGLPSYTNNLLRHGFTEVDLANGGSDRLIDELVVWGEPDRIAARLREHLDAGANHVAIQSLNGRYDVLAEALKLR